MILLRSTEKRKEMIYEKKKKNENLGFGKKKKKIPGKREMWLGSNAGRLAREGVGVKGFLCLRLLRLSRRGAGIAYASKKHPLPSLFCCRCSSLFRSPNRIGEMALAVFESFFFAKRHLQHAAPTPSPPFPPSHPTIFTQQQPKKSKQIRSPFSTRHHPPPYTHTNPHVSPDLNERTNDPWRFCPISAHERKIFSVGF